MVYCIICDAGGASNVFSTSLERVFRRGQHVDFVNVDGMPGMYISNHLGLRVRVAS